MKKHKHLGKKIETKEDVIKVILETIEELQVFSSPSCDASNSCGCKVCQLIKKLKVSVGDADA